MQNKKKILFLGTRIETLNFLDIIFDVTKIITTKNSYIEKSNYNCTIINKTNKEIIFKKLIKCNEQILISAGFPYYIPINLINKFELALNCHPGKLPKYRGYYSIDDVYNFSHINVNSSSDRFLNRHLSLR